MNGWLLYQVLACRVLGAVGVFYQSGERTGSAISCRV